MFESNYITWIYKTSSNASKKKKSSTLALSKKYAKKYRKYCSTKPTLSTSHHLSTSSAMSTDSFSMFKNYSILVLAHSSSRLPTNHTLRVHRRFCRSRLQLTINHPLIILLENIVFQRCLFASRKPRITVKHR